MKVCFPIEQEDGLKSPVYGHFGSAPAFLVADAETGKTELLQNQDLGHEHGRCSPLRALGGTRIDTLVTGGIGGGALMGLSQMGIAVYRAMPGTVGENLEALKKGKLQKMDASGTCSGHQHGHGGGHGGCCGR